MKQFNKAIKRMLAAALSIILTAATLFTPLPQLVKEAEAAGSITSSDFLKTNGKDIRNNYGSGDKINLRGTNAGGYLLQEFWMCPTKYSYGSYTVTCEMDIYKTLTARFGEAAMRELIGVYQDSYWTEADFDNCKALGMNCIRLPFWYMNFVDFNGNYINNAFSRIDWFLEQAGKRGMYVILDMHGAPGSQNGSDHSGVDGGNSKEAASQFFYGNNAWANQQLYYDLWYKIAQRYKDNPVVAGYDLLNEPYCTYRYNASLPENTLHTQLWDIYNNAYNVIRSVDQNHIIIMEATWDPWDLPDPSRYGWSNVMYEYHNYLYDDYDNSNGGQIANMQKKIDSIKKQNYNVPSYMGEFCYMNNTNAWQQGVKLLNDSGIHWTTWTYKVTGSNNNWGLYNQNIEAADVAYDSAAVIRSKWSNAGRSNPNTALQNAIKGYFLEGQTGAAEYPKASITNGDYYITSIANNRIVCADNTGNDPLAANRENYGGAWETFTVVNNSDGTVSFQSRANGKYVCAVIDESSRLLARSSAIGTWEKFTLYRINDTQYGIRAAANGSYVKADLNNSGVLHASSSSIAGSWEAFTIQAAGGSGTPEPVVTVPTGGCYLTSVANSLVVCAENYGNDPLIASRSSCGGAWETLNIIANGDGTYSFRSGANNKYICAVIDDQNQLVARSSAIDRWEKFYIEPAGNGQFAVKSAANGLYVKTDLNNAGILKADSQTIGGTWEVFKITKLN